MKIAVTGASGMLGADFVAVARVEGHEVHGLTRVECDISDRDDLRRVIESLRPDAIVHCAAMTDVDECERDAAAADRVNAQATGSIAGIARQCGSLLVYISSCGVFDGTKTSPYVEDDAPCPLTAYARSKISGEQRVAACGGAHLIVRPGWLYGGDESFRKNFVLARRREALDKGVLASAIDRWGSPTWTRDLAAKTLELMTGGARGLVHVANGGIASRFDYVTEIVARFGIGTKVEPVDSSQFPRRAAVPANEALGSVRLAALGVEAMRPWRDALGAYIRELLAARVPLHATAN